MNSIDNINSRCSLSTKGEFPFINDLRCTFSMYICCGCLSNVPVLTSCHIPSTDMVALASGFPSTSLTTPLIPRCTFGDKGDVIFYIRRLEASPVQTKLPVWYQLPKLPDLLALPSVLNEHACSSALTCSMKDSRDSLLFSHSRGSSLSWGNLSQPRKMDSSKQLVCR